MTDMTDASTPPDPQNAGPHAPHESDDLIVYYEGSPRLRGEIGTLVLWSAVGFLIAAIPIVLKVNDRIHSWLPIVIGIPLAIICWVIPSILVRRAHYRVTNYRIDYDHGFLFKTSDTLELWHVEDISLRQSPLDRIFRVGTITIVSGDATTPRLLLRSIEEPRNLLESLKQRIISVKRQRGVLKLDR